MFYTWSIKQLSIVWTWWRTRNKINAGEGVLKIDVVVPMVGMSALECEDIASSQRRPHKL